MSAMPSLATELTSLMVKHHFRPNKKLGQHFLVNPDFIEKMVKAAELKEKDVVLEIGPGTGFLTRELIKHCKVEAVELDAKMAKLLRQEIKHSNFHLIEGDFLKVKLPSFNKIVACPPFNISTEIMLKLFQAKIDSAVLLLQKDFTTKLMALPGFPGYTATSCLTTYFFESEIVSDLPSRAFFPPPKTPCAVIKLLPSRNHGQAKDEALFIKFIKSIFRFKNKSLANALKHSFPFLKGDLKLEENDFKQAVDNIELKAEKVYALEVDELVSVFNQLIE
jgi:16S rRNA (adenine1518-N6/adenine1519-N6)-dimethyltransferase